MDGRHDGFGDLVERVDIRRTAEAAPGGNRRLLPSRLLDVGPGAEASGTFTRQHDEADVRVVLTGAHGSRQVGPHGVVYRVYDLRPVQANHGDSPFLVRKPNPDDCLGGGRFLDRSALRPAIDRADPWIPCRRRL